MTVHLYADHLEVYDRKGGKQIARWDRKHSNGQYSINPYHVAGALASKPGALHGLQKEFKEQMFPRDSFKLAYDRLKECDTGGEETGYAKAGYHYAHILLLVGKSGRKEDEDKVDQVLRRLLEGGACFGYEDVKAMMPPGVDTDSAVVGQPPFR